MDKSKCLRCGEGEPFYCEKCYQDLIGENARLQYHLTKVIPTEERLVRLQDIINHFEKIKDTHQTVDINSEDIKAIEELIATNQHLKYKNESYLNELEEPINVLINFAVCCSPSLNCDEYCSYNDEDCTCGKLNEDFELRESVLKLRKYFKMKG